MNVPFKSTVLKPYHIAPNGHLWALKRGRFIVSKHETKLAAEIALELARNGRLNHRPQQ